MSCSASLMSSLDLMTKQCIASGTRSSAGLKRRLIKKKKRKVAPTEQQDTDSDCQLCRCSVLPSSGSSRTVRRIQAACILSLLALLGSVSMDLSSNFELLNTTGAAYNELTSCRTLAILQLVSELQKTRRLFAKQTDNDTQESSFPDVVLSKLEHLCSQMSGHKNRYGFSCSVEVAGFCPEIRWTVQQCLDANSTSENRTSDFTLVIERLLEVWGSTNDTLDKVKQSAIWTDVLSVRLLVTFTELNHQLMDVPHIEARSDFQHKWTSILACLGFATFLSERLGNCWLENTDVKVNSSKFVKNNFEAHFWPISGTETMILSGSQTGIRALTNTRKCLFDSAVPALRMASRSVSSSLSMKICLLTIACLIYPVIMFSFKQMAEWIQNYARTLKEKTQDLKHQRQLAEDLLHQMLPKSVAKQLRKNKHVEAVSYDKVTIFFSDIVGFTSISASCSPLQVVEMLNNLYMCFDTRIDSYDVYKVETIGDAYMVVSGLPERNEDRHADEIAKMALDLVAAVRQVSIPHMPNHKLQLRVGIHTGPCVAGIVGYKMPRYCLFGDTVNTASRMESTSLPQKIHISSETYLALIKDNAYEMLLRGEIDVKGKGKMNTYWLVGHKNYSVQNDSLVCHYNPSMARKKKTAAGSDISMATSSVTVQSFGEHSSMPVSSIQIQTPPRSRTNFLGLNVSAHLEPQTSSEIGGLSEDQKSSQTT